VVLRRWAQIVKHSGETPLGRHLLADLQGISKEPLSNPQFIEDIMRKAAIAAGATPIFGKFHHFGEGLGVTGVLLLKESHISIHTWPEHGFAAVDVFMCGECRPEIAIEVLREAMGPTQVSIKDETRGRLR
jgi:S-adenosylmethionine decarboxylase